MPELFWDLGTGYDLFVSLFVLHNPLIFGLRGNWAAGVRSRIPTEQREFFEKAQSFLLVPLAWINSLPKDEKTANDTLQALENVDPAQRIQILLRSLDSDQQTKKALDKISEAKRWQSEDVEIIRQTFHRRNLELSLESADYLLQSWTEPALFGERYLKALRIYQDVFFAEEEERILPALKAGMMRAKNLSQIMPVPELLEELSQGIHFNPGPDNQEVVLAPSYWSSPLVFWNQVKTNRLMILFGSRPAGETLVPGESVPEDVINGLKALSDPTRLRIVRYLSEGPQTPTELARRLRLRPPTVIHHLSILRLAGMVRITILPEGERRYALRREALKAAIEGASVFLGVHD